MGGMLDFLDHDDVARLIQTALVAVVALALFFGLKTRFFQFARWARLPRLALTPIRLGLRYAILVGAVLLILSRWGFQINGLIAVLGTVGGLIAIGFVAMWSVLSNFLCTIVLAISKPFSVGDEVELPTVNVRGKVTDMTMIFTTLETTTDESVLVPNNTFFQVVFKRRRLQGGVDLQTHLENAAPPLPPAPAAPR
ncbi:MAG TPA: mechanosensitive ion channel domain-containing protein [Candidatus Didemnitutus sp.]|nr:mechanosensitive ion channel domain-containing protein [Candidatus Didemnitutus sp.]